MEIRQLRYFVEICKQKSYVKAAEICCISVQGISMAMSRLENELNTSLFIKTGKEIAFTSQAKFLLPRAEAIIRITDECNNYFTHGIQKGSYLPIMLTPGAIEEFAGEPLAKFKQRYNDINVYFSEDKDSECEKAVVNHEVELAISSGPVLESSLSAEPLYSEKIKLLVNNKHEFAKLDSIDIEDIDGVSVVLLKFTSQINAMFTRACRNKGFELKMECIADSPMTAYRLVEQQNAVSFSTESLFRQLGRENIKTIPINDCNLVRRLYLIKLKNGRLSPQAKLFEESMIQYRDFAKTYKDFI